MIDEKKLLEKINKKMFEIELVSGKHSAFMKVVTVNNVKRIIAEQPKVGEWIPVSERLPEKEQSVLAYRGGHIGDMMDVYTYKGENMWEDSYGYYQRTDDEGISAWMPLPEAFKGE